MADAPRGTITFLFTDIVGSTRLWEKFPDQMRTHLVRHDALVREAAAANDGYVFKTVGDSFCVAFPSPLAALQTAIQTQRGLLTESWGELGPLTVRMGIHTGTAEYRDGDYFGGTLNRVARIESAAHGGQILLSQISYELLQDEPPPEVTFKSLGDHRLRNLDRPEHLFQAVVPGLPDAFPPPDSMEIFPNNLPAQATSFVGRQREMDEIKQLLARNRVLTLTGMGGTGKTRLSLQVGAQLVPEFRDGVWLVELALTSDPHHVTKLTAAAVGAREEPGRPLHDTLLSFLRSKNTLILLDNCEHLLAAVGALAADLLRVCPQLKILATSRHSLGIAGEATFPVPTLTMLDVRLQELSGPNLAERLSQYEAVRLFIERATAVRADFTVTNANAPALAEICSRLDGIPLAIELAAARVRVLDLEQIAERLHDRFRLLRSGGQGAVLPRQQTLQALIDWSYDLLSAQERLLFRRLGVFTGGRTLEALDAVCSGEGLDEVDLLDLLQQLVDKSLVTVEREAGQRPRYTMIETVWHYAREKLEASGEAAALRDRHLTYFLQFAETAAPHLEGPKQKEWLDLCQRESFNFRNAFEWAIVSRKPEPGYRMIKALYRVTEIRSNLEEMRDIIGRLLALPDENVSPRHRADALLAAGRLAWASNHYDETRTFSADAQQLYETLHDQAGAALAGVLLGLLDFRDGHLDSAEQRFTNVILVGRSLKLPKVEAIGAIGLGSVALERGDASKARELKELGLAIYAGNQDYWMIGLTLWGITQTAITQKDFDRARSALAEWASLTRELGNRWVLPYMLECHGSLALDTDQPRRAARCFGAAEAMHEHFGEEFTPKEQAKREASLARLREALPEPVLREEWAAGRNASPWELIEEV